MVLKDTVNTYHGNVCCWKCVINNHSLWQTMCHATGAQHLERVQYDYASAQFRKRDGMLRVEPLRYLKFWGY